MGLSRRGDRDGLRGLSGRYVRGDIHTNMIEGVFSVFKRGTYQHCGEQHLQRYPHEFDFRYSNRVKLGIGARMLGANAMRVGNNKRDLNFSSKSRKRRTLSARTPSLFDRDCNPYYAYRVLFAPPYPRLAFHKRRLARGGLQRILHHARKMPPALLGSASIAFRRLLAPCSQPI